MSGRREPSCKRRRGHHRHGHGHGHGHGKIIINNFCGCCPEDTQEDICDCEDWDDLKEKIIDKLEPGQFVPNPTGYISQTGNPNTHFYCALKNDTLILKKADGIPQEGSEIGIDPRCKCWEDIIKDMEKDGNADNWSVIGVNGNTDVLLGGCDVICDDADDEITFTPDDNCTTE